MSAPSNDQPSNSADLDVAGELTDDNNLMADLEFEQMLTAAVGGIPVRGTWEES